jgi:hypothetical protein
MLKAWSSAGGVRLGGDRNFRRWSLAGGSKGHCPGKGTLYSWPLPFLPSASCLPWGELLCSITCSSLLCSASYGSRNNGA